MINVAGKDGYYGYLGDGGRASFAKLNGPLGVIEDGAGNIYFCDSGNNCVRRIDATTQNISTIAGKGSAGFSGDNGPATLAQLENPVDLVFDSLGNLYIADQDNCRVRKVATDGTISTIAGNGNSGFLSGDNGPAVDATLDSPAGLAIDPIDGSLAITQLSYCAIRRVDLTAKTITTICGDGGLGGFNGDSILAVNAQINNPSGIRFDAAGNLFFVDAENQRVRKIMRATGIISTIAGTGQVGFSGDNGPATAATFHFGLTYALYSEVGNLSLDSNGNIYLSDVGNNRIRYIDHATQIITTIAGDGLQGLTGDVADALSHLTLPSGIFAEPNGNYLLSESEASVLRHVVRNAQSLPLALTNLSPTSGVFGRKETVTVTGSGFKDGATVTLKNASTPGRVAISSQNELSVVILATFDLAGLSLGVYDLIVTNPDSSTKTLNGAFTISPVEDVMENVAGTTVSGYSGDGGLATAAKINLPAGLIEDTAGNIYFCDSSNGCVRRVDSATKNISTIAGTGFPGFSGDNGPATMAQLHSPSGLVFDSQGNLYIADQGNNRVRKVTTDGTISTIAGNGKTGFNFIDDNGPAINAATDTPYAVLLDPLDGSLVFSQLHAGAVRRVNLASHIITTLCGDGVNAFKGDYGPAIQARVNNPSGIRFDANGNLFIVDAGNERVRMIDRATGEISTFAGTGQPGFLGDNGGALDAAFLFAMYPALGGDIALDSNGNLYICDTFNQRIRSIDHATRIVTTIAGNGSPGYDGNFVDALNTRLNLPLGILVEANGNFVLSDSSNEVVRRVVRNTQNLPFALTDVSPNSGGNTGVIAVSITGTGIVDGATALLRRTGQADVPALTATNHFGLALAATFDLTGQAPGVDDVVVTNPDHSNRTLSSAFTITAAAKPPSSVQLYGVSPNTGGNTGTVAVSISGTGIKDGATAVLHRMGQADIPALTATNHFGLALDATFDLSGQTPGVNDLVVTNPDMMTGTLSEAFLITAGSAPSLSVNLFGSDNLRGGRPQLYFVQLTNHCNVDILNTELIVTLPAYIVSAKLVNPTAGSPSLDSILDPDPLSMAHVDDLIPTPNGFAVDLRVSNVPALGTSTISLLVLSSDARQFKYNNVGTIQATIYFSATGYNNYDVSDVIARSIKLQTPRDQHAVDCLKYMLKQIAANFSSSIGQDAYDRLANAIDNEQFPAVQNGKRNEAYHNKSALTGFINKIENETNIHPPGGRDENNRAINAALKFNFDYPLSYCPPLGSPTMQTNRDSKNTRNVVSVDPNDKSGPGGPGGAHYIARGTPTTYVIEFENMPTATGSVQTLLVTDPLDTTTLDPTTLNLGLISFADQLINVPPSLSSFQTDVDLRPARI